MEAEPNSLIKNHTQNKLRSFICSKISINSLHFWQFTTLIYLRFSEAFPYSKEQTHLSENRKEGQVLWPKRLSFNLFLTITAR